MVVTRRTIDSGEESASPVPKTRRGRGKSDTEDESAVSTRPKTASLRRLVTDKHTDSDSSTNATPTRRLRRLSTDLKELSTPETQVTPRRTRRASTDGQNTAEIPGTPTKRSRCSTDPGDLIVSASQTPTERTGKATDSQDTIVPGSQTPSRRSKRLSADGVDRQDTPVVRTPAKRGRRNSTDGQDTPGLQTPARRSRRLSGAGIKDSELLNETQSIAVIQDKKSECEVEEVEALPVIEEIDEAIEPVKENLIVNNVEEKLTANSKQDTLPVIEEVEEEVEVVGLDKGVSKDDDHNTSSTTNAETNLLVVADETVSTTVTTDEDGYISNADESMIDKSNKNLNRSSEEMPNKDREVTSTTNITLAVENQESELTSTRLLKHGNGDKEEPINNNIEAPKADLKLQEKNVQIKVIPRGLPVSGRWWKKEKERFRSINKDATGKKSWAKKMKIKQERQNVLAKSAALEAEKQRKKEELRERQRLNKERREENAKKSEIVQLIKDPRKIKKMKKKQLRYIQTRDTTELLQK